MPRRKALRSAITTTATGKGRDAAPDATTTAARAESRNEATQGATPPANVFCSDDIYSHSDREQARLRRDQETLAAAAANISGSPRRRDELMDATRRRDSALRRLDAENCNTSSETPVMTRGHSRGRVPGDRSGLDLADADDDLFADIDDSFADDDSEPSLLAAGLDDSSSIMDTAQFRRLSRRPSSITGRTDVLLRPRSQVPVTPTTSANASTLNIGAFRRRKRETSILGSLRRPVAEVGDGQTNDVTDGIADRRETRGTKRKSTEALAADDMSDHDEDGEDGDSSSSDFSSVPSPLAIGAPLSFARPMTPTKLPEEIFAPPASSGSERGRSGGDIGLPDIHRLAKRRRRRSVSVTGAGPSGAAHNLSDVSSPPSLTHSPNPRPAARTRGRHPRRRRLSPPNPTTADLTNLLPQRRHRGRSRCRLGADTSDEDEPFDLPDSASSSAASSDEDEQPHVRVGRPARRRGLPVYNRANVLAQATKAGRPVRRTYGSTPQSHKENEKQGGGRGGKRAVDAEDLRRAAIKFEEVDRWQLNFEDVAAETSSLSNAR